MNTISLRPPYVIYIGDEDRVAYAKTGVGLAEWRPELCCGQIRHSSEAYDMGIPDMSVADAVAAGAGSIVIGTAPVGGTVPESWMATLIEAAAAGIDVVAGLHSRLNDVSELVKAAKQGGSQLIDVRVPPAGLPIGSGKKRAGKRLLTVGTDCALGKKYTALQLEKDMRAAGMKVDFRATGQTGIMIAGEGLPLDAVVSDFLHGAAEVLSPDNDDDHWDVIEGQGGIFHPGYAAVSHGLLVGSQPDAFVVCHFAHRIYISGWDKFPLRSIGEVIDRTVEIGQLTNPDIRCVGISVNTGHLDDRERREYLSELSDKYSLPCVDPMIDGTGAIIEKL